MTVCPYCAEEVKEEALVCPHCRRTMKYHRTIYQEGIRFGFFIAILAAISFLFKYSGAELSGHLTFGVFSNFVLWSLIGITLTWIWRKIKR